MCFARESEKQELHLILSHNSGGSYEKTKYYISLLNWMSRSFCSTLSHAKMLRNTHPHAVNKKHFFHFHFISLKKKSFKSCTLLLFVLLSLQPYRLTVNCLQHTLTHEHTHIHCLHIHNPILLFSDVVLSVFCLSSCSDKN